MLEKTLGMSQSEADTSGLRGTNEGSQLAGNAGLWDDGDLKNNSMFGSSGFFALPGGWRYYGGGEFVGLGDSACFWSASKRATGFMIDRILISKYSSIFREGDNHYWTGYSVRLIKD